MSIFSSLGTSIAVLGAALAAILSGMGSAKGVGLVGQAGAGVIGSGFEPLSIEKGLMMFAACMPIAIVGYFSAIAQGKTAAAGVSIIAKKPDQNGKAITMAAMVETYAVIALLVSILSIFSISGLNI